MPCACRAPLEQYPENAEWGPLFWRLLHGMAEFAGKQTDILLQGDERREWVKVFNLLKFTLPCDICRNHYTEYLTAHPAEVILDMPYKDLGLWIRTYWWTLHNHINEGNSKPVFPWDSVSTTYKGTDVRKTWKELEPVMKKVIILSGIPLLRWKGWLQQIRILQGLYS